MSNPTSDTTDLMAPFGEGLKAGIVGCDPRECPYDKMTKEWGEWQRGQTIGVTLGDSKIVYGGGGAESV